MTNITDLQDVVVTLEYHDEENHAQMLREYICDKKGWRNKAFAALKTFMFWFLILGTTVAVVYGFIRSMLDGSFFAALGILLFGTVVYAILLTLHQGAEAIYDWYKSDMSQERVA